MSRLFEEIDSQTTPLGEVSLRRRRMPGISDQAIYEVKLGEEFLMSSLFVEAEVALARLGLAAVAGEDLRVVVGGLGLGYTAVAALEEPRVGELLVVEMLAPVIDWHRREQVPLGATLNRDPRCRYRQGDFFHLATDAPEDFDPERPGEPVDAILLDIDHSPRALLNSANARFYTPENLALLARRLREGGVFAMWSNEPPDAQFQQILETAFDSVAAHTVYFHNPFQDRQAVNTVYVAG